MMLPDGPALTAGGLAVDVYDGSPMFFSHEKELSEGHRYKVEARAQALQLREERYRRKVCLAALLVDLEKVGSVSGDGVLHGPFPAAEFRGDQARRLRCFHDLRQRRHRAERVGDPGALVVADDKCCWLIPVEADVLLCLDEAGVVRGTSALPARACQGWGPLPQRLRLFHRKKQLRRAGLFAEPEFPVACAHPNGFVSWVLPTPPTTPVHTSTPAPLQPPVCRIDLEGHVHDVAGLKPPQSPQDVHCWERLKLFHRKRHTRWQAEAHGHVNHVEDDWDDVYVSNSGTATPIMEFATPIPFERTCSMDSEGILHQFDSHRLERTCSIDSEGLVHSLEEIGNPQPPRLADRLKLFHRKKHQREHDKHADLPFAQDDETHGKIVVSLDGFGRIQGWSEYEEEPLIVPVM